MIDYFFQIHTLWYKDDLQTVFYAFWLLNVWIWRDLSFSVCRFLSQCYHLVVTVVTKWRPSDDRQHTKNLKSSQIQGIKWSRLISNYLEPIFTLWDVFEKKIIEHRHSKKYYRQVYLLSPLGRHLVTTKWRHLEKLIKTSVVVMCDFFSHKFRKQNSRACLGAH